MSQDDKLSAKHFATDIPMIVTITETGDTDPWVASDEGEYGQWYKWKAEVEGAPRAFFPSDLLNSRLTEFWIDNNCSPGTSLMITKIDAPDGAKGIRWLISIADGEQPAPAAPQQVAEPAPDFPASATPTPTTGATGKDRAAGIFRMGLLCLDTAEMHMGAVDKSIYTTSDIQDWASTLLIACQKEGIKGKDFPDVEF